MTGKQPTVDLVILNYNSGGILSESFPTLLGLNYPQINFIIVDNGSTDGSDEYVRKYLKMKNLVFIKNRKNLGCPGGLNAAIPHLKGKYSVFLNEDIFIVDKEWLKKLVGILEENPSIGALGSPLVNKDGVYEGNATYFSKLFSFAGPTNFKPSAELLDVPYIGLGMMITRTDLLKKIGGFREKYFLYWDDVDYCMRLWVNGYRVSMARNTLLQHLHQGSIKRNISRFKVAYLSRRNSLLFFYIFYPAVELIKHLPTVFLMRIGMLIVYLKKRYFIDATAMLFGSLASLCHPVWVLKERRSLPPRDVVQKVLNEVTLLTPDPYRSRGLGRRLANIFKWL